MPREKELKSRSASTTRSTVSSKKSPFPVLLESMYELVAFLRAEFTNDIVEILHQPATFKMKLDRKLVKYTPDLLITYEDGSYSFVEVKDHRELLKPKTAARIDLAKKFFSERDEDFFVLTDIELMSNRTLNRNLRHLKRYRTRETTRLDKCKVVFDENQQTTVQKLYDTFGESVATELIANQRVWCDLEQEITGNSIIKPSGDTDYVHSH